MNDRSFIQKAQRQYKVLAAPYGLDHQQAKKILVKLDKWQRDPDNDCLRSRGDWKWILACDLSAKLNRLLEPF
jgi:hypothetical protein